MPGIKEKDVFNFINAFKPLEILRDILSMVYHKLYMLAFLCS